ncbi:MAG TPA: hypothetical protein VN671_10780 [Solirubrobacterales bacterium]|nr:hypothetical protein [Solirubrobacterales bacterium]
MRGREEEKDDRGWLIAVAPGAFAVVAGALALAVERATGTEGPVRIGLYAFGLAVLAGIVAPIALVVTRRRDFLMWLLISICVSAVGLLIAFMLLFAAAVHQCGPGCLS